MLTAAHCWLSRRFSMFVLCILFVFVLTKTNKIHNTNIENRRDNQEWAAVNIGYNKQNEDKQNTQHKHRKPTGQPAMADHSWLSRQFSMCVLCILFFFVLCIISNVNSCPLLVVLSVFYVCVVYFVCLRSVYCINTNIENRQDNQQWAAVNIGYNKQNEDKQNTQHKHRKLTGQPGMGSCKHWIQ
jgi:Flp pilus assembly protein TadB